MNKKYAHILHLPHHVSEHRPHMSMYQRAAQFAPFAALTGHGAAISESARLTDSRMELSESEQNTLDRKLAMLLEHLHEHPSVCITYFVPDSRKAGGSYTSHTGVVRKWDGYGQVITFDDGVGVALHDIIDMSGHLFLTSHLDE